MEHRAERRAIVELARLGNARHTAELLGVSKSTISEVGVRRERSYGTRLFDRDRRACGRDDEPTSHRVLPISRSSDGGSALSSTRAMNLGQAHLGQSRPPSADSPPRRTAGSGAARLSCRMRRIRARGMSGALMTGREGSAQVALKADGLCWTAALGRCRHRCSISLRSCGFWGKSNGLRCGNGLEAVITKCDQVALSPVGVCFPGAYRGRYQEDQRIAPGHGLAATAPQDCYSVRINAFKLRPPAGFEPAHTAPERVAVYVPDQRKHAVAGPGRGRIGDSHPDLAYRAR